ncbi:hypothetical protein [Pseudoalteromonas rubra]|uniref:Uncharacterized protein n=1 Tax=Pseudoalteromonas rubra TaxID=43658 RepID=A0A0U3GFE9_9GAMM|nr:hypothetical protein [Pseudoalteromonas rubra]ALU41819.1 hypothetical protein AT705_02090 [Pseudoalteromonas rubra]
MRSFLAFFLLLFALKAEADCSRFKTKAYDAIDNSVKGVSDGTYSHIPFLSNFKQLDDVKVIEQVPSEDNERLWTAKITCSDSQHVFFSLKLLGEEAPLMDGMFFIKSGGYYSGPYSLVSSDMVIIQADKL